MSDKKVHELGAHNPSVASVISRLDRHQGKIKHIAAVIEWEDGSCDVVHDEREVKDLCYDAILMDKYIGGLVYDKSSDS